MPHPCSSPGLAPSSQQVPWLAPGPRQWFSPAPPAPGTPTGGTAAAAPAAMPPAAAPPAAAAPVAAVPAACFPAGCTSGAPPASAAPNSAAPPKTGAPAAAAAPGATAPCCCAAAAARAATSQAARRVSAARLLASARSRCAAVSGCGGTRPSGEGTKEHGALSRRVRGGGRGGRRACCCVLPCTPCAGAGVPRNEAKAPSPGSIALSQRKGGPLARPCGCHARTRQGRMQTQGRLHNTRLEGARMRGRSRRPGHA